MIEFIYADSSARDQYEYLNTEPNKIKEYVKLYKKNEKINNKKMELVAKVNNEIDSQIKNQSLNASSINSRD